VLQREGGVDGRITEKAYKVRCFDGSEDIIPASCVFGRDESVTKCDAYWIAAWILPKKNIQYSSKKRAMVSEWGSVSEVTVTHHRPQRISPQEDNIIDELKR